jgi:PEP-CTERM/exosortase A-associated glycosyltransferase
MINVTATARREPSALSCGARPLRILHVLDHSLPIHSGYTFRTLAILKQQRALGWDTFQLTGPKQGDGTEREEHIGEWMFYRTPAASGVSARLPALRQHAITQVLQTRLAEVVERVRPDILHAHSPVLNALPALAVGAAKNIPVVYEVRAFWEDAAADLGTAREWGPRYRLTRMLETRAMRRADAVTTICEGLRGDIVARGIPAAKVSVIPNAVDVAQFEFAAPHDRELMQRYGLTRGATLGFAGSFYAYEGLDILLRALPQVLCLAPQTRLMLLGGGPQEAWLRTLTDDLGLDKNVHFIGRVPHGEINRYCSTMDIMVYPRIRRRLTELVTPLKPLEAMAMGKLVAASNVGGHRELIRDGYNGHLFPAGSAAALAHCVTELLFAPQDWAPVIANGRALVEHERNWPASVARYRAIYASVLNRAAHRQEAVHEF